MPTIRSQVAGAPAPTLSVWANNFGVPSASAGATANASLFVSPLSPSLGVFPGLMTASTLFLHVSGSMTATSQSSSHSFTASLGLYTLANSTLLSLLNSASSSFSASANTGNSSLYHGGRQISFHSSLWSAIPALSQAQYWFAFWMRSSNFAPPLAISGFRWMGSLFSGDLGVGNTNSLASRPFPGMGVFSVSFTTAMPGSIAFSDLKLANSNAPAIPTIVIRNIGV